MTDIEKEAIYLASDAVREIMRVDGLPRREAALKAEESLDAWNLDGLPVGIRDACRRELWNLQAQ